MRRLIAAALLLSCARRHAVGPSTIEQKYLRDPAFRRATLEASVGDQDNAYARLRRQNLATWEKLPEYNPEPIPISQAARRGDRAALRELGAQAFVRYPNQLAPRGAVEGEHGMRHLVPARLADGTSKLAFSCATCHSDGTTMGAPSQEIDLGALITANAPDMDPARREAFVAWGKGRLDVTTDQATEVARIADLRAVRFQKRLQHSGAVKHEGVASLALRVETLLIGSHGHALRPPREIALGLAVYLESLGENLPPVPTGTEGARVFADTCGKCHEGEGLVGDWVKVDEVGTDPVLARSLDRGTGHYRIPSLRGVSTRGMLLHDGSVTLAGLLDPERVGGHTFGKRLTPTARAALLAFLQSL
ncbi:MAG: hypothetical protein IPJ34_16285 [Myxococcales bacterium]|nr:hypothetical protein [Myxococcales bacterium]